MNKDVRHNANVPEPTRSRIVFDLPKDLIMFDAVKVEFANPTARPKR